MSLDDSRPVGPGAGMRVRICVDCRAKARRDKVAPITRICKTCRIKHCHHLSPPAERPIVCWPCRRSVPPGPR